MANKHVINPCDNSGKAEGIFVDADPATSDIRDVKTNAKGVLKLECPVCGNEATVNKKTLVFRKHSKDKK